jgi:hypothetical protein
MGKQKKLRQQNVDKRKKRALWLKSLWVGGLLVILFFAVNPIKLIGTRFSRVANESALDPASVYIRRETRNTLPPALFVGRTAAAYRVAQEIPNVLDRLYCYCHCDKSIGHVSLLSCFADTHAANCGVCQNEAFDASGMVEKGYSLSKIRHQIDLKYGRI